MNCLKCKNASPTFVFRDSRYCDGCFVEQFKHSVRFSINSKPKAPFFQIEHLEKPSMIVVSLWDTMESLGLLKYVLFYEFTINTRYKNISYRFLLFRSSTKTSGKYLKEIQQYLSSFAVGFEEYACDMCDEGSKDFLFLNRLLSVPSLEHSLVYLPSTQYHVAYFTLLLTIRGQGKFIPAFSTPSIMLKAKNGSTLNICRPLFYVSNEDVAFFNSIADSYTPNDPTKISNDIDLADEIPFSLLSLTSKPLPSPLTSCKGTGACQVSACSNGAFDTAIFDDEIKTPSTLPLLIEDFLKELQNDSNDATISILSKTAQKLDTSYLAGFLRCIHCPIPDFEQPMPCESCKRFI